jgi:cell division protein FtsQ
LRSGNLFTRADTAVLDAPERDRAFAESRDVEGRRRAAVTEMPLRRDSSYANNYDDGPDDSSADDEYERQSRRPRVRLSFHGGLVPKSLWGRIAMSCALLLLIGAGIAAGLAVRNYLLHDAHFVVPSSDAIQIADNSRLTRPQLLSVFGEDVERNIFNIPLAQRRAQLESLPWVEHATVMRLLPNRVRVAIVERTPVAFVRQGSEIGLVDANGVLLNLPGPELPGAYLTGATLQDASGQPDAAAILRTTPHYSFPVLTGISGEDPLSTRAARMKIYMGFVAALDASGENISHRLSEVDVSNPEDVKAILPDSASSSADTESGADMASGGADVLVHFGDGRFLERYREYEQHLAAWRAQYPRLASVDLRYERQVVLEMQPGAATAVGAAAAASAAASASAPATASTESSGAEKTKPQTQKAAPAAKSHAAAAKWKRPVATKRTTDKPAGAAATASGNATATGKVAGKPFVSAVQGAPR